MQLTDAEWKVMDALWRRHPASVRDVLDAVGSDTDWAYSTVKTILDRLAEKGAVVVRRDGLAGQFEPAVTRDTARRSAVRALVDRAFDGTVGGLFQHLVGQGRLSAKDRRELRALLDGEGGAVKPKRVRR